MGMAYYPTQTVEIVSLGVVNASSSSVLLLSINGVVYPNGFRVDYDRGYRLFSPSLDANSNLSIVCVSLAYGEDLPAYSLSNVEVYIIG